MLIHSFIHSFIHSTDKLQLVLINVLVRSIFEHYLQGSVSTRLRCDGIFNDQFINHYTITAESKGEKMLKIGQHLPKLWAIEKGVVFYETRCICSENQTN